LRYLITTIFAVTAIPLAAAAQAPSPTDSDARCLLTMAAVTSQADANMAQSARIAVGYFAGRIKAREPSYDFANRLKPIAATLNGPALNNELKRCGPQVQASMTQLEAAFRALSPKPPPGPAKPPARK
jgi:hypothetical protein